MRARPRPAPGTFVAGASKLRRKMKRMRGAVDEEVKPVLKKGGESIRDMARLFAPRRRGTLRRRIKSRVYQRGLQVKVGPWLSKADRRAAWYAQIVHGGVKGQTVTARKRRRSIGDRAGKGQAITRYRMRIAARAGIPFMSAAGRAKMPEVRRNARKALSRALDRTAAGEFRA
jgi:HK97 gp10 family phage protein